MSTQYVIVPEKEQVSPYKPEAMARGLARHWGLFLAPLVLQLDRVMEKRLWRTLVQTVQTIICLRDRSNGLLLAELGGYLLHPSQARACTKRLSNLLHSPKWRAQQVDASLWQQAEQQVEVCQQAGEVA